MTARRLRRENKPDVKRFLYVPLPIATVSFVGSEKLALPWNAVMGRVLPQIIATHRILSQNVVIGRKLAARHKGKKNSRPDTPSPLPYL